MQELGRLYRLVNQLSEYHALGEAIPKLQERIADLETEVAAAETSPKTKQARKQLAKLRGDLADLREELASAASKRAAVEQDSRLASLAGSHPDIARQSRQETAKLHGGDPENTRLWNQFLPLCLAALNRVYERLGVRFDQTLGESYYQPMLDGLVRDLKSRGLATQSDGALCVFNEGFKAPFIVQKADGAFLYATTDLATIAHRVKTWAPDDILYVVDNRQSGHFEQLFATARKIGYEDLTLTHVSFGTILGDDKKPFKTRSGDTVGLESLLDEAVERAYNIVAAGDDAKPDGPEWDESHRRRIAEIVGLGGIKYADLKHNRESDYIFSWEKMLSTNGDTATYMQYAYARIAGISRRGGVDREELRTGQIPIVLETPEERALALRLTRFSEAVEGVARDARPNVLTEYLFGLAGTFTAFYEACPVLKASSPELRLSRLVLCDITARMIAGGLELLGIDVSDGM